MRLGWYECHWKYAYGDYKKNREYKMFYSNEFNEKQVILFPFNVRSVLCYHRYKHDRVMIT